MKKLVSLLVLSFAFVLTACGDGSGKAFEGKWQNTEIKESQLEIKPNGKHYLVVYTHPASFLVRGRPPKIENIPAVIQDGILKMTDNEYAWAFTIDDKTGQMVGESGTYKKIE